ncbi:MAG: cupredoxin domain-containing protein [Gemmatimonadota bacterium]|nr:cupredoxin domain-containing protein [Gemmatimonadota bacterium]
MQTSDWVVIAAGLGAIAWVNWYFFLAERGLAHAAVAPVGAAGGNEVVIIVRGGYTPAVIRTAAGQPIRLVFDRQESSSCSEEVVFPDFGVKRFLPENEKTTIEIIPPAPGTYEFTCGMGMLHGRLIAERP